MVIQRRTVTQFETLLSEGIASRDKTLDTAIGAIKDLYVTPSSEIFKNVHDNIVYLSQLTSLKYANRFNPSDLDDFLFNESIVRWTGSPSIAVVTFSRLQPPSTNIPIPTNFPLATIEDPLTGTSINFRTIESKIMYGPLVTPPSSYFNPQTERYEIDVTVQSIISGSETEVGAHTITVMRRAFADMEYVTNKQATTSGRGLETNADLAERYQMQVKGNQEATPTGLKSFILDTFNGIRDSFIVYGNSTYMVRHAVDAGAVDNWVMGESPLTHIYNVNYPGVRELIPLPRQPLINVTSVTSGPTTYVEGTDYEIVTGEGIYSYSDRGFDGIRFLQGGSAPTLGGPLTITYNYNSLINVVTAYYKQPDNFVMGNDTIYRWAQKKYLEIEAILKIASGDPDTVLQLVRDRVINYINNLQLGVDVEEFDINREVGEVFGIDNWVYVTLAIKGGGGVSDITVPPNEHAYIEPADLVISLTS